MIIYNYILKEHILPFIYSIGVITFIFITDLAIQLMDSILSKGLNPKIVFELFALNLPWMIALSIPMGFLVSTLMAFGKLSSDNEILALKASGASIYKMIVPPLVAATVISVGMIFFNNTILPESNHKASILMTSISRKKPAAFLRAQTIISDFAGYRILIGKLNPKTSTFKTIKIYEDNNRDIPVTTYADSGSLKYIQRGDYLKFTLLNGETHRQDSKNPERYLVVKFKKQIINIKDTEHKLQIAKRSYRGDREMSATMMLKRIALKKKNQHSTEKKIIVDISKHRKLLKGAYCIEKTVDSKEAIRLIDEISKKADINSVLEKQGRVVNEEKNIKRILGHQSKYISRYLVEVYKKYSIPAACIAFVLIGAPLGIKAQTSGIGVGTAYSIAFFILYWACLIGGETLADKDIISPFWAMWTPNFLIAGSGIILIANMVKETTFFSYKRLGKRSRFPGLLKRHGQDREQDIDKIESH